MSEDWLYLNPFVRSSVPETEIWAEEASSLNDVTTIHADVFEMLWRDLRSVRADPDHTSRIRFLVGHGGAGKSHLFSRLRRRIGNDAIFAFASNPPTHPSALLRWTLGKVISGLRRPRLVSGDVKPYSQIEALLYLLLLREHLGLAESDLDELHEFWTKVPDGTRADYLGRVHRSLTTQGYEGQSLRALLGVLRPETRDTAFTWLSGSTNLLPEELNALGQAQPIEDEEAIELLKRLGHLSCLAGTPIVLVLDQLDLMLEPGQIAEFQRLLMALIDQTRNWHVVIGLVDRLFEIWQARLSDALRTRLQALGAGQLPVTELVPITDREQKTELIRQRLASAALAWMRRHEGVTSDLFPLGATDLEALAGGHKAIFPRDLLKEASAVYTRRAEELVGGGRPPRGPETLESHLLAEFEERRSRIAPDTMNVDKAELVDRMREVVDLVALAENLGPATWTVGPLEQDGPTRGTDTVFSIGGRILRILSHHAHRKNVFPAFLRQANGLPSGVILVRDGAVSISGAATSGLLSEFRRDKHFLHLSRPEIADLFALGEILAELREGNFASLVTDPVPTSENARTALASHGWFRQHRLTRQILAVLRPEATKPQPVAPPAAATTTPAVTLPADLPGAIQALLRSSRWLMLERLRLHLKRRHAIEVGVEVLRNALGQAPLSEQVICYPRESGIASDVQILVWNEETDA